MFAVATMTSGSAEVSHVIERLQSLSARGETTPELFQALAAIAGHNLLAPNIPAARSACVQMIERAEAVPWGGIIALMGRALLGGCQLVQGEIAASMANLERAMELPQITGVSPFDLGIIAAADAGSASCLLGRPSQGRDMTRAALDLAESRQHDPTIVHVVLRGLRVAATLRDEALLEAYAARIAPLPEQLRAIWGPWSEIAYGLLECHRGHADGAERMLRGRDALLSADAPGYHEQRAQFLAMGLLRVGRHDEADVILADALAVIPQTGVCYHEAELRGLRAEILLARRAQQRRGTKKWHELAAEAEAGFREAHEVARHQGAKWWELRIAVSLARLLSEGERAVEGCELLRQVFEEFEEGFELPDLRAARALLDA
jgi:hypothetical protein